MPPRDPSRHRRPCRRVLALILALTFTLPHFLWAFEPSLYNPAENVNALRVNPAHGIVTERFQGSGRLVILVQDLHCHAEAQENIAALVDELAANRRADLVAVEGAWLPLNVTKLVEFPLLSVRRRTAETLLRQGKITGTEWVAALGQHPLPLEGIEDRALYAREWGAVKIFLNDENLGYVQDLREALAVLKNEWFSPDLQAWDRQRTAFRQNGMSVQQYLHQLCQAGRRAGWEDAARVRAEKLLSQPDLDAASAELEVLDRSLRERLYTQPREKELDAVLQHLDALEDLLNISATEAELNAFRREPERYSTRSIRAFLASHLPAGSETDLTETEALDAALPAVDEFYRVADLRSLAFVRNTLQRLAAPGRQAAILVAGGFHAQKITEQLRQQGVSYAVVKPSIRRPDAANRYFEILRGRQTPLEQFLHPQHALAPPLASPQTAADPFVPLQTGTLTPEERSFYQSVDWLNLLNTPLAPEMQTHGAPDWARVVAFLNTWSQTHPGMPLLGNPRISGTVAVIPLLTNTPGMPGEPLSLVVRSAPAGEGTSAPLAMDERGTYRCELRRLSPDQQQALLQSGLRSAAWSAAVRTIKQAALTAWDTASGRRVLAPAWKNALPAISLAAAGLYLWVTGDFGGHGESWAMLAGAISLTPPDVQALGRLQTAWQTGQVQKTAQVFDLHGRPGVLDAVLREVRAGNIQEVIFHGDAFDRAEKGNLRVFLQLKELKQLLGDRCVLLLGNHDAYLIEAVALQNEDALARWMYYEGDGMFTEMGLDLNFAYRDPSGMFPPATGFKGFRRAYIQRKQFPDQYQRGLAELTLLLKEPRARRIHEMSRWMLANSQLYHVDEKGWMHVHAGLPVDALGNPKFTPEQLETLQQNWLRLGKAIGGSAVLDPALGAELQAVMREALDLFIIRPEDWLETLLEPGALDRLLRYYGIQGVMAGHTENAKPTVRDGRVIIGDVPETYVTATPAGIRWVKPRSNETQELVGVPELLARIAAQLQGPGPQAPPAAGTPGETGHAFSARLGFVSAWGARLFVLLQLGAFGLGSSLLPAWALPLTALSILLGGYVWVAGVVTWARMGGAVQDAVLEAFWNAEHALQNQPAAGAVDFAGFRQTPQYTSWQQERLRLEDGRQITRLQLAREMPVAFYNGLRVPEVMRLLNRTDAQGGTRESRRAAELVERHETFQTDLAGMLGLLPQVKTASVALGAALVATGLGIWATAGLGLVPLGLMLAGSLGLVLPAWLERQQAPATSPGDRRLRREQNILRLQRERQRFLSFSKSV